MDKATTSQYLKEIKLASRARGLVFVHVSTRVMRYIAGKTVAQIKRGYTPEENTKHDQTQRQLQGLQEDQEKERLRLSTAYRKSRTKNAIFIETCIQIRKALDELLQKGICSNLADDYRRAMLLKKNEPYRTDAQMILAYQLNNQGSELECIGFTEFGAADPAEDEYATVIHHADFRNVLERNKVLEIDLICVSPRTVHGNGSILLLYTIFRELHRTKRGEALYEAVLMNVIGLTGIPSISRRFGFQPLRGQGEGASDYNYQLLHESGNDTPKDILYTLGKQIPNLDKIDDLCALAVRTGVQSCN